MHDWDDLRFFLAVARGGSVSAAAMTMGKNQSTVSRRINSFEEKMNVRLFERLSTGYRLTDEGEELLQSACRIEEETLAIEHRIKGKNIELKGPIRLTTSLALMDYLLMPILRDFKYLHAGIELQLDLTDNIYNLNQRQADVALRVAPNPPPDNLIGRELGRLELAVYGERRYLANYLRRKNKPPLRWIGEDNTLPRPNWLLEKIQPLELVMRSNDVLATLSAIRHGLGVGRLPALIGDSLAELLRFEATPALPRVPLWLLTHADMRRIRRISVFNAFIVERIVNCLKN